MQEDNSSIENSAAPEEAVNLRHYWHVVLERRWLVITTSVTVFVLCLVYLFNATPIYQAVTRIEIGRDKGSTLGGAPDQSMYDSREMDYLQTQYKNLQSRTLMEAVVKKLNLDNPKVEENPRYAKRQDIPKAVLDDVTIAPIRLSRLVDVKVEHPSPAVARDIANSVAEIFKDMSFDRKLEESRNAANTLKQNLEETRDKMLKAQKAVTDYQLELKVGSFDDRRGTALQSLQAAQQAYDTATAIATERQATADEATKLVEADKADKAGGLARISQVNQDRVIQAAQERLQRKQAELSNALKRYKDGHPTVIGLRADIAAEEVSIREHGQRVYETLQNDAHAAMETKTQLAARLTEKKNEMDYLDGKRIHYMELDQIAKNAARFFDLVEERVTKIGLDRDNTPQSIFISDPATIPYKPIKPRIALTLCLGMFGGLLAGFGLAFFVNYLDDSIKSQDDVEAYLKLPFLGYVPNIKTNSIIERDLQAHVHPQSNAAEGFRTIRAAVSLTHHADRLRIITVTSTIPGEGKSLVASNLAIVNAQTGMKTLLVDADLRRPSVHKAFQLQSPIGLSSYLQEKVKSVDEIIHASEVPNLDVVCCGAIPNTPSELIGSKRMQQFIQEARNRYDRVVLDCPPVSAVSDPLVVASISDGVIFVTKFNKIRREHARKSVQRIQNAGVHIIGAVLNDIDFEGRDSYYYSYYYYQNRYYSSHYQNEAEAQPKPGAKKA